MREFDGGWSSLELSYLADSLIIRSIEVGHARALTELQQYVSAEDCNYQQMIFIGGIEVERPQNLAKGISIIPFPLEKLENWARLPYDRLNSGSNQTLTQIKAALIREGSYPKRHELRENIDFNTPFTNLIFTISSSEHRSARDFLCGGF